MSRSFAAGQGRIRVKAEPGAQREAQLHKFAATFSTQWFYTPYSKTFQLSKSDGIHHQGERHFARLFALSSTYRNAQAKRTSFLSYLSRSLADRWGTTVNFTTSFLHSSWFSAFRSSIFHSRPVHSLMLSAHRFLCLPLRLPP